MKIFKIISIFLGVFALLGFSPLTFADDDHFSDDWKISIDGKTASRGTLSFKLSFKPAEDGTVRDSVVVSVPVPEDAGENDVADMIGNAFKATLGEDDFDIDTSWGENVKVEAKRDTPDFSLVIADNPLQGISLEIKD